MQDKIFVLPSRKPAVPGYPSTYNVPLPLTPLIGREQEVAAVCDLLKRSNVRLVTLIGPGGVGKTHLSLQIASDLLHDFTDGICFVPLASISDPELVIPTIAQALGLKETQGEGEALIDLLQAYLRDRHVLLLLDNFEQVVAAAARLSELLAACARLKMLVTSRAVLRLRGEHEFRVPPLALPDLKRPSKSETFAQYAAVALFVERAQAARASFQLTDANARAIAQICVHLDGLPLAIELAAVRIKLLSPQALLGRLEQRLPVLASGTQDVPVRQQTLHDTIEWSYQLLEMQEQRLFQRLSVFVGGCTLAAIESVCAGPGEGNGAGQMLDSVASLIDKSLLQQADQEGDEPRFMMLETIREYALERLIASGEAEATRQAHAMYYLRLSEEAEREIRGPQQALWLERLEREHDNLRAALRWLFGEGRMGQDAGSAETQTTEQRAEMALRLGRALTGFWQIHGYYQEGRTLLEQALAVSQGVSTALRAQVLTDAAMLVNIQGDTARSEALAGEGLELYRELGDKEGIALALYQLGHVAWLRGDFVMAGSLIEESMELSRELGDTISVAYAFYSLAGLATIRGDYARGSVLFEEGLTLFREEGNKRGIALSLLQMADLLYVSQGDQTRIGPLLEEGLALCREIGDKDGMAFYDYFSGKLALSLGDIPTARALLEESLTLYREMGDRQRIARSLVGLAKLEAHQAHYTLAQKLYEESLSVARIGHRLNIAAGLEGLASVVAAREASEVSLARALWAARLWGAAEALRDGMGAPLPPVARAGYEHAVAVVRTLVGEEELSRAWAEGRGMTPEQALAAQERAIAITPLSTPAPSGQPSTTKVARKAVRTPANPEGLTAREVEVLRLVAQGLTNVQVAEKLVITRRTVNWYLTSIYDKIGVSSRSAATRYAIEHDLV